MPFTTALKPFPRLPSPAGALVDAQGKPTPEFYTFLTELRAWAALVQAALDELEP